MTKNYEGVHGLTPIDIKDRKNITVPPYKKIFSLSSCTSNAFYNLLEYSQSIDFELTDNRLVADGRTIDIVYNRLTDFYLQSVACTTLREAYESGAAVFTPGPRAHALYANKKNLTVLCDEDPNQRQRPSQNEGSVRQLGRRATLVVLFFVFASFRC